jgi:hypothetical protein
VGVVGFVPGVFEGCEGGWGVLVAEEEMAFGFVGFEFYIIILASGLAIGVEDRLALSI